MVVTVNLKKAARCKCLTPKIMYQADIKTPTNNAKKFLPHARLETPKI